MRAKRRFLPWLVLAIGAGTALLVAQHNGLVGRMSAAGPSPVISPVLAGRSVIPSAQAQACGACHEEAYRDWLASHHAPANRLMDPAQDTTAFVPQRIVQHDSFVTKVCTRGGLLEISQTGPGGRTTRHRPEAVIGITPLIQYLVAFPGGRLQVVDMSYDPRSNEWFNVFGDENRQPHEWGFWTNRSMTWNVQCAFCHMTGLQKNYDPATDSYHTTWDEMGVSCAQCHGPMTEHTANPEAPLAGPQFSTNQVMENCATCHSRREEMTGTFRPGDAYADHFRLALADQPSLYFPDGQILDEVYVYGSFLMSRMHLKGVSCLDCHNPHSGAVKLPVINNTLCMSCHTQPGLNGATPIVPTEHSHHGIESTGNRCIECHMPMRTYMQRDPRRDHGFTSPDPLLSKELGIPNACNQCHTDKSVDWSIEWVDKWYGDKLDQRPARARARLVARARDADAAVIPELLGWLETEEIDYWRATLLALLAQWSDRVEVRRELETSLAHSNALVRAAAVNALSALPDTYERLKPLRKDPVRQVRLDAAWATLNPVEREAGSYREVMDYLRYICDQPAGALRQSQKALTEGQTLSAEEWARKALAWDPSAYSHYALGRVLHAGGKQAEAAQQLENAVALDPRNATYLFALGLLYGEVDRLDEALQCLQKTVEVDPQFGRGWYNLGLLHAQLERLPEAAEALGKAESLLPASPDPGYALATVQLRLRNPSAAKDTLNRVLILAPEHEPSRALLRRLP